MPKPVEKAEPSMLEQMMDNPAFKSAMRSAGTVIGREITRSIFGTGRRRRHAGPVRVYLPLTLTGLAELHAVGRVGPAPLTAHARAAPARVPQRLGVRVYDWCGGSS